MKRSLFEVLILATFVCLSSATVRADTVHVADDTHAESDEPDETDGDGSKIEVSYHDDELEIGFMRFDIESLAVDAANVAEARLRMFLNDVDEEGEVGLHLVEGAWDEESLTFANKPSIAAAPFETIFISDDDEEHYVTVDITDLMMEWLDGSQDNYGIALCPVSTGCDGVGGTEIDVEIDSKENTKTSHGPEIEVVTTSGGQGVSATDIMVAKVDQSGCADGTRCTQSVFCPTGWVATGGGFRVPEFTGWTTTRNRPNEFNARAWEVEVYNNSGAVRTWTAYAKCLKLTSP